jgi:hypothetical protein
MLVRTPSAAQRSLSRLQQPGVAATLTLGLLLFGFAVSVDFPKVAYGFQSDEATYYSLGHSLAEDFDFTFRREDLARVWEEFPTGPEGIFLKRGKDVDVGLSGGFPFVEWRKAEDPDQTRLYYGKAYIYPLVASPFILLFGTNGFLVLHAVLMTLNFAGAYAFLSARSSASAALAYAGAFFLASAAPVYFVWLTPDFFNLSIVLYGLFLWSYKEVARPDTGTASDSRFTRLLFGASSDYLAAALLGVATFSKPLNVVVILPLLVLAAWRRQWRHGFLVGSLFGAVVVALFLLNVGITGEFNYQGGDRKTFYGGTGFPFQTDRSSFETTGMPRATDRVLVEVLVNRDAVLHVFRRNIVYFLLGRHTGLVPYFFPGVLSALLFLAARGRRQPWQWLVGATVMISAAGLLLYMPFTYSGGGGPIGNRYYMGFYPLLLFLTPPLASVSSALAAVAVGGLFTAQLVMNPFYSSFYPSQHPKSGAYRLLPVELSLLNDLPMNVTPSRVRQPLGGEPRLQAYFLDDNAYNREGDAFWIRGESTAELIVRAPAVPQPDGSHRSLRVKRLAVEIRNGPVPNRVTIRAGGDRRDLVMDPRKVETVALEPGEGLPYKPFPGQPTNYVYLVSAKSAAGFVPLFVEGSRDNRFLGAMIRIVPDYE